MLYIYRNEENYCRRWTLRLHCIRLLKPNHALQVLEENHQSLLSVHCGSWCHFSALRSASPSDLDSLANQKWVSILGAALFTSQGNRSVNQGHKLDMIII